MTQGPAALAFDFHCHIDLYPDPVAMIAACASSEVVTLAVTTTPKAWPRNRKWARNSAYVHAAVGLHPEVVAERYHELPLLEEGIRESRLIGEIGLDGSPQHRSSWSRQIEVFGRALSEAERLGGRVVSIHSRRAARDVLKCIENTTPAHVLPILHWFSGSPTDARKAVELGCYFSINARSLEHETGLALIRSLPEDRLLTETDGPFTSHGDRVSEPADVVMTLERLAAAKRMTLPEMARVVTANARRVFAFAGLTTQANERLLFDEPGRSWTLGPSTS